MGGSIDSPIFLVTHGFGALPYSIFSGYGYEYLHLCSFIFARSSKNPYLCTRKSINNK